jgi:hypothetical protein
MSMLNDPPRITSSEVRNVGIAASRAVQLRISRAIPKMALHFSEVTNQHPEHTNLSARVENDIYLDKVAISQS